MTEGDLLELYHSINSVCAQKVRIALAEKGLSYQEHLMRLGGDQFDPAYMKLNPNAVVPTLIHDGQVVIESSVILYYLDEAFPEKPLMPAAPLARAKVRLFNKLIEEHVHNSCTILTFATAFRPGLLKLSPEEREAGFSKSPSKKRSEYKRDAVAHGLDSGFVKEAVEHHEKLLTAIEDAVHTAPYLAGGAYSLADIAVIPYILQLELLGLSPIWDGRPGVATWWARPPATVNGGGDLQAHDRGGRCALQESSARSWAKVRELLNAA